MENQNDQMTEADNAQITQQATNVGTEAHVANPTECLSTNSTLFWRVFLPIFGTVFLGGLLLTFLLIPGEELYLPFPILWGRLFILALFLGWLFLVSRTLWRLKRVDASATHFFVTNYWVTVRYPWTDVEKIEDKKRMGKRVVQLFLRAPGRFGQKISFLPDGRFDAWKKENNAALPPEN